MENFNKYRVSNVKYVFYHFHLSFLLYLCKTTFVPNDNDLDKIYTIKII